MSMEKYQQAAASISDSLEANLTSEEEPQHTPIEFISDVTLEVCVEFGRTMLSIEELLKLKKGSVIALDGDADSPMAFRVNGNKVGSGEVVVVNENFGVRITSIEEPQFSEDLSE